MIRCKLKILFFLLFSVVSVLGKCPWEVLTPLPFALEYAIWRGWQQTIIFTPDIEFGCKYFTIRLMKCLSLNGVASAVSSGKVDSAEEHVPSGSRLGLIILAPYLKQKNNTLTTLMKELHKSGMDIASNDWLILTRSDGDFGRINKILNGTSIRFDQNLIVAYPHYRQRPSRIALGLCDNNFSYKKDKHSQKAVYARKNNISCNKNLNYTNCFQRRSNNKYEFNYFRSSQRLMNLSRNNSYKKFGKVWPLLRSGIANYNDSDKFEMMNITRFSLTLQSRDWITKNNDQRHHKDPDLQVVQYFKVRLNSTLYAKLLGIWNRDVSMGGVNLPYPADMRNFLGEEMVVGRCNYTGEGAVSADDDGPSAPASVDDVLHFLTVRLNATSRTRFYNKLGLRTYEGTWTGLLGALTDNSVDIALEPVTARNTRHQDMDFVFPIAETMSNIYIRQQETSTVRDIFLAPFSVRLVVCVWAVAIVASIVVVIISRLSPDSQHETRRIGFTEALIWSTGILCQQGGTWTPPNPSASILLIVCLLFAVVTYNSYAAFITSVLSVRVASVDNVAAVLRSPKFKIGYIRNGADQMYLMSTKDAQLNAFYIRGYSDAENLVTSAEEGLVRAASQDYAFFAGQRAARSSLRSLSQARGRCAIREVPVLSTRAQLTFPLPRNSPYARPILISLLRLRSSGSLARLKASLVPEMPQCTPPPGFASARAIDVQSALIILVLGYVTAWILGVAEYCLKNRKEIKSFVRKFYKRFLEAILK